MWDLVEEMGVEEGRFKKVPRLGFLSALFLPSSTHCRHFPL
jgi:hypothetical protein